MLQRQELRKAGLKVTLPRLKILEILESDKQRHLSAEDIYKELLQTGEDIGLATVYRVLTQFETAGLVNRHNFEGGHSVFEIDEGKHHDHMVCVETGDVVEFINDDIDHTAAVAVTTLHPQPEQSNVATSGIKKSRAQGHFTQTEDS